VKYLIPAVFLFASACASKPAPPALPPFDTSVSVKDLMANDDEWNAVKAKAITLVEIGNLLMLPARSGGNDEWVKLAQALIAQSQRAIKAAEAHDKDGVFNTGADIYEACVNCHKRFDPAITSVK
jgi:hypothetical protein